MTRAIVAAFLTAAACGGETKQAAPSPRPGATGSATTPTAAGSAAGSSVAPTAPDPAAADAHLKAGRAHAKAKAWTEALASFDRGLVADPTNPALLSEATWAAFSLGRLDDAKTRGQAALAAALAGGTKAQVAAAHYNLGRIAEAQGLPNDAKVAYDASLAVRANDSVRARRLALDRAGTRGSWTPTVDCKPAATADLCACLATALAAADPNDYDEDDAAEPVASAPSPGRCDVVHRAGDVEIWQIGWPAQDGSAPTWTGAAVIDVAGAQPRYVRALTEHLNGGRRWTRDFAFVSAKAAPLGARQGLEIRFAVEDYSEEIFGEGRDEKGQWVAVCAVTAGNALATCPVIYPELEKVTRTLDREEPEAIADFKREYGHAPPWTTTLELGHALAPDGGITLRAGKRTSKDVEAGDWVGRYPGP